MLSRLARLVAGSRTRVIVTVVAWVLLAGLAPRLAPSLDSVENNQGANDPPAAAESMQARELVRQAYPDQRGTPAVVVLRREGGLTDGDIGQVRRIGEVLTGAGRPDRVEGVVSTVTAPRAAGLISEDRSTTVILVSVLGSPSDPRFNTAVDRVREIAGHGGDGLEIRVTGPSGIIRDTLKAFGSANFVLLFGTLGLVLVLLLLIYRSPLLALIPLVSAGIAVQITNALGAWLVSAGAFEVTSQATSIMTVLLFGVGTDYCLFVISRYRERLVAQPDRLAAMREAVRGVGESMVSSAATIVLGLLVLLFATLPALRSFGPFLALSVAVMLVVGLTFVPALVVLCGRAAFWPARPPRRVRESRFWARIAGLVLRVPGKLTAVSLLVLLVLSLGLLGYKESYNFVSGFRVPTDSAQGQELLNRGFPPGELAPTTVLVEDVSKVDGVAQAVGAVDGVKSVSRPVTSPDGRVARLSVVYVDDPYQSPALDRTQRVREVAREAAGGARVLVGGESAVNLDLRAANNRDLSVIVPLTLLVIALVLMLMLRSLVAPLYMILTTVASLLATVGVTVAVLVTLGGDEGIGNRVTAYIFIFLVALGVDYNIFLLSRVRQEVRAHGFTEGLRTALVRTGGVISSAGVILAGTFAVLMTQPIRELFQFGFAMAVGVLLDTFLVRGVLVPSLVRQFGRWNWWPGRVESPEERAVTPMMAGTGGTG